MISFVFAAWLASQATSGAVILPPEPPRTLTADEKKLVMREVYKVLKDPESARFRWPQKTRFNSYCGWVNAKNGYGGYAGYSQFSVYFERNSDGSPLVGAPILIERGTPAQGDCARDGYDPSVSALDFPDS